MSEHPLLAATLAIGALLVLLGSPGPWLEGLFFPIEGMDGDGQVTLGLGGLAMLIAGLSLKWHSPWLDALAALALATAGGIGLYNWIGGEGMLATSPGNAEAGWGLALVTIGGLGAMAAALLRGGLRASRVIGPRLPLRAR